MKSINIVIPMKPPEESKQRLKGALQKDQRHQLAMSLFEQTLSFFQQHFCHLPILVVTRSELVAELAKQYGANVLFETSSKGLNQALTQATHWSLDKGFDSQLILPADIARLDVNEMSHLLACDTGHRGVAIAVAKDKGTNALLCSPPDVIPCCFGFESSKAHQIEALNRSLDCHLLDLPLLGQDVDIEPDLAFLSDQFQPLIAASTQQKSLEGESYVQRNG